MNETAQEIAELKELFVRRLNEDKAKAKLIDELTDSLRLRDSFSKGTIFADLMKELLVSLDRLQSEEPSSALVASIVDEVEEVLRRRGLRRVPIAGEFNPKFHEIINTVQPDAQFGEGEIVEVERDGYQLGETLLRPAEVVIAKTRS